MRRPKCLVKREPGSPPVANPILVNKVVNLSVRRLQGATNDGNL